MAYHTNHHHTRHSHEPAPVTKAGWRNLPKPVALGALAFGMLSIVDVPVARAQDMSNGADNFYKSDKVTVQKVTFKNQYQMNVAGNLFIPKSLNRDAKHPAIVVGHPMGAVKEQSANLYATKMAERGFVTLSLDLSFWGESEGQPRNAVAPGRLRRGLQRRGGLPGHPAVRRPGADRRPRDLRQRELRHQRRQDRPAHEGHRDRQHVRHGGRQPQRAQEVADPRAAEEGHRRGGGAAVRGVRGRRDQVHQRDRARADRGHAPHPARVLRLLPHAPRRVHPEGLSRRS